MTAADRPISSAAEDDRPAPVVPDSAGLREPIESALKAWALDHSGGIEDNETPAWKDATDAVMGVLAVVGQGVTAEQAWDEGFADGKRHAFEGDGGPRFVNPYRAVVRSGEQGGEGRG